MDHHSWQVILDAGNALTFLFAFAVAATRIIREHLAHQSSKFSWPFAVLFALALLLTVYALFSDMSSLYGVNAPLTESEITAYGYLIGQLVIPLILGIFFAFDNIRILMRQRAERQRLLEQLKIRYLALEHPDAAATVEALTNVLKQQSRTGLLQNIWLGAIFYVLGIITPYIIGGVSR